jgi:hypothetical protein
LICSPIKEGVVVCRYVSLVEQMYSLVDMLH